MTRGQRLAAGEYLFPQPPDITDVHRAQEAAHEALSAPDAEYEVAVAVRARTESAFLAALDRADLSAETGPEA